MRRLRVYTTQNAILIRGTPDQVRAARKLIGDIGKTKSQVVVDVIVMEASRSRSRQISPALSGGTALGIPMKFTPRGAVGSSTDITLSKLGRLSTADFSLSLPELILALDASDTQTHILQNPQVRASDGQKASLKIQRIPFATGSFNTGGSNSLTPLVSTQFQYADVGVNADLIPHVHGKDEVTLHVDIDVSSVTDHVEIGGVSQPVIGQRKIGHELRLKGRPGDRFAKPAPRPAPPR